MATRRTTRTEPLPRLREIVPELNRREYPDRRAPKTFWSRFKLWLDRRWKNWRRWLRAAFDATGMAMGAYSFFRTFGTKVFYAMLAIGLFLAPIESE